MSLAKTSVVITLAVFILVSFNRAVPAEQAAKPPRYAQLNDAELDDIIKRGEWPKKTQRTKPAAITYNSGWVPRYAAVMLFKKLLRRNGIARVVIYKESKKTPKLSAGAIVIDRARWKGRVREGKRSDLQKLKRAGLRRLERQLMARVSTQHP